MFCTPEIAPEPYAAEAPPVTMSTRLISTDGMKFEVDAVALVGRHEAAAVDQRERAAAEERVQAAQVRDGGTGEEVRVAGRVRRVVRQVGRQLRDDVADVHEAEILDVLLVDHRGRVGRIEVGRAADARAGHGHFIERGKRGAGLGGGLVLGESDAGQAQQGNGGECGVLLVGSELDGARTAAAARSEAATTCRTEVIQFPSTIQRVERTRRRTVRRQDERPVPAASRNSIACYSVVVCCWSFVAVGHQKTHVRRDAVTIRVRIVWAVAGGGTGEAGSEESCVRQRRADPGS